MTTTVHTAPVVLTLTGPPLRDAAVVVEDDLIAAVGPAAELSGGARVRAHRGVLLPGLLVASVRLPEGADDDAATARGIVHALLRTGVVSLGQASDAVLRAAAAAGMVRAPVTGPAVDDPLVAARDADGTPEQRVRAAAGGAALVPGARADLAVFDVPTEGDPYAALVAYGAGRCTATVLAGRLVHRRR